MGVDDGVREDRPAVNAPQACVGAQDGTSNVVSDRVWTLPNVLSMGRLLGVPLFLWCVLTHRDHWALGIVVASGVSDFLDGWIARRFGLVTELGQLLDPIADRLYILSTILGLAVRAVVPWWFVAALLGRDVLVCLLVILVRRRGYRGLPVHFVGKAATFNLLYAFPLLLVSHWGSGVGAIALPLGWAFAWWGLGLYWVAGFLHLHRTGAMWAAAAAATAPTTSRGDGR